MRILWRNGAAVSAMPFLPLVAADAQQPMPAGCLKVAVVCALKYGQRQTYWNACMAARDGAELLYPGYCAPSRSYG